jgi:hypothetical protein
VKSLLKVKMADAGESRALAIEKLTGMSDYNSWAYAMQMYLIHENLWDYVTEDMADSKNYSAKNDKKTLSKIVFMIKPELYPIPSKPIQQRKLGRPFGRPSPPQTPVAKDLY